MEIVINGINPMGAVRMTRNGKWTNAAAQRYLSYKEHIKWDVHNQTKPSDMFKPGEALRVELVFKMPIPASFSLKIAKRLPGTPHMKKPDIDNLVKSVFDAINGIVWADDNQVASVRALKIYSTSPGIEIIINRMGDGNQ